MLLSDSDIRVAMLAGDITFGSSFGHSQIQPSSVDLTAGRIYAPDSIKRINQVTDISNLAIGICMIEAGETIVIELAEDIKIDKGFGGILMPPNSLTKNGIIMTNPGHIDPGYRGKLTVCLINMGKDTITIETKSVVATLLLFKLSSASGGYNKPPGTGVNIAQLSKLSRDFANISERSYNYIKKSIWGHLTAAMAIASLGVALLAIVVPSISTTLSGLLEAKYSESKNSEAIKKLTDQVQDLQNQLAKQKNLPLATAPEKLWMVHK